MIFPSVKEQLDIIVNNTVEVISTDELERKLTKSLKNGTPLKIKLGADDLDGVVDDDIELFCTWATRWS